MKLTVSRSALLTALGPILEVTNRRSPSPYGSCVLLQGHMIQHVPHLTMRATDSTSNVKASISADLTTPGTVAVPAKDFADRIAVLTDGPVDLSVAKDRLTIKQGKSTHLLRTLNADAFPAFPTAPTEHTTVSGLGALLDCVSYATGDDPLRAFLCGVVLTTSDGKLHATASDSLRFARCSTACEERVDVFLTEKAVKVLARAIGKDEEPVRLSSTERTVHLTVGSVSYAYTLPDVAVPAYDRLFGMVKSKSGPTVSRRDLIAAIRSVTPDGVAGCTPVVLRAAGDVLHIEHTNAEGDKSDDEVPSRGDGKWTVRAEGKYMLDALGRLNGDEVSIGVTENDVMQPIWIQGSDSFAMVARMDPSKQADARREAA